MTDHDFVIGLHRPVYLWAGPGTVRMNRLKFMDAPVDEAVHAEAHTAVGARRMAEEAGFTWAYLMYNWGFPPETEAEDREEFRRAVEVYHAAGMRVFGYVQLSNYVDDGSYQAADWYAVDPRGRPFYYYTGRYMTCWLHPAWREHLRGIVEGIVEAGADGVFFDNPWHGIQPMGFGGTWLGPAGCYCARCRAAFREATGLDIPQAIAPQADEASRQYVRWRAEQVTGTLAMLADQARSLRPAAPTGATPGIRISANDFDAVMRPSYLIFGIDLAALARVQDVIMIEDYGLPRWEPAAANGRPALLVNNALTLRTARALIGATPLSTDPYDQGIGFDAVYAPRRFQQGIAEAAACGATMVVKGTEYVEEGTFTLLTAERYGPQRQAIGQIHRWLAAHAGLYRGQENAAVVGLLYPGEALWQNWHRLAPRYFGLGQALLAAGIPWRVMTGEDDRAGLEVLLCLGDVPRWAASVPGLRTVAVDDLAGWAPPAPSFLARHATIRGLASRGIGWSFQAYFRWRPVRRLVDGLGLVHFFWQTPFFRLPPVAAREALLQAMGDRPCPNVRAAAPVLAEVWRQGGGWQLHLVNYATEPQAVRVEFGRAVQGQVLSPDGPARQGEPGSSSEFQGADLDLVLDVYTVLAYE